MAYRRLLLFLFVLILLPGSAVAKQALRLDIDGAIGPAIADYVQRGLKQASEQQADLVILRIDTPGGLDSSMRDIIQAILASPVAVVGYVSPNGARAASAGTYILYACHVAAMAPATNLGAATPVSIGGGTPFPGKDSAADKKEKKKSPPSDAMTHKAVNDAVAYIRGLARLRGRNADWAEKAVREAASLEAQRALEEHVIDLVAKDMGDLLKQLQERKVTVLGRELALDTTDLSIEDLQPDWRSRLLGVLTDPNVAYILMLLGIYGLIFEFSNPGAILPGVAGAIALLLALYAFQVLPINYAGLGLILLGVALMVTEALQPGFGVLGFGGIVAFVFGSIILIDTDVPGFGISLPLIGAFALASAVMFVFVIGIAVEARKRRVVSGAEQLIGLPAEVLEDFEREGRVRVHSELWQARSPLPLRKGQRVRVTAIDGLILEVDSEQSPPS